jgi:hypothetical protein
MGQREVFMFMVGLRKSGDHSYHSAKEILKLMGNGVNDKTIYEHLTRLHNFGFIESGGISAGKGTMYQRRAFRARL